MFTQPFIQTQIKENIKAPRHWPLCGDFTGTGEFPAQLASNAENVSIWWHHHVFRGWLAAIKQQDIIWANMDLALWCHRVSPRANDNQIMQIITIPWLIFFTYEVSVGIFSELNIISQATMTNFTDVYVHHSNNSTMKILFPYSCPCSMTTYWIPRNTWISSSPFY